MVATALLIHIVAVLGGRLYSLTEAGWSTVATLQARRAGATLIPGPSARDSTPRLTVAHGSGDGSNSSGADADAQVVCAPNGQASYACGIGGDASVDVGTALIERTLSTALAHMPQQSNGPVWATDAADDPGWVRTDVPTTRTQLFFIDRIVRPTLRP
eukprot:COSAG02_NODE_20335_length_836_cov_5.556150_1_plen_158_part_00